jgi:hypothetical protein
VTVRNITYLCEDEHFDGMPMSGGVLGKGQLVWIRNCPSFGNVISAYVAEIGLVRIDSRFLVRASSCKEEMNLGKAPDSKTDMAAIHG